MLFVIFTKEQGTGPTIASDIDAAAIDEMLGRAGNLRSRELKDVGIRIFFTKGISNPKPVTGGE
jgi:hypothetical protein